MSATTAGEPGRRARTAPGRRAMAAAPRQRAAAVLPGPAAESGRPAVPGRRVVAAVPRERVGAAPRRQAPALGPGQLDAAVPGQRLATAEERGRPGAARPRRPKLTVVPPLQAENELPPPPVPAPRAGAEPRAHRAAPGVPARPVRASARPRIRLTRRGRIVVATLVVLATLLVVALAWLAGTATAQAARSGGRAPDVYRNLTAVIVRPGESLWAIAMQADPTADPRSVIQEIVDLNALGGTSIQPGQRLWVPRG